MSDEPSTAKQQPTKYVILKATTFSDDASATDAWVKVADNASGASAEHAIKAYVGSTQVTEGVFRAIPERSWKGAIQIEAEVVTRTKATLVAA